MKKAPDIRSSEITDKKLYLRRREFIQAAAVTAVGAAAGTFGLSRADAARSWPRVKIPVVQKTAFAVAGEKVNSYEDITTYNNYYEFGTDKEDPANNAGPLKTKPWTIKVDGLVAKPADYQLEDLIKPYALEERTYRMRCVEAWSMVIPWVGFPLASLLKTVEPTSAAKFVEFRTLYNQGQMPGQRRDVLIWPYVEALRLDEAMNPLALLAVGLYGEYLPNQNGAPIRLVVPWKYGFKGIKSIVNIRLTDRAPRPAGSSARRRIRVLCERESLCRSSALVAGARAPHRRVLQAADADVQRLRRSGGVAVPGLDLKKNY